MSSGGALMQRAMTLVEILLVAVAIGVVLAMVALGVATVRNDLKHGQVEQLLATLDEALSAYHQATGHWPVDPGAEDTERALVEHDGSADRVVAVLASEPASRAILDKTRPVLRVTPVADISDEANELPWGTVQDAWGRRLRCLTAASKSPLDREAVAINDGRPIFICAGPDAQFGNRDISTAADNLRSDRR